MFNIKLDKYNKKRVDSLKKPRFKGFFVLIEKYESYMMNASPIQKRC